MRGTLRGSAAHAAISVASGLGLALAFPRASIWVLGWIAPVPWLLSLAGVRARRGFFLGFAFGLGYFGLLLAWIHGVLDFWTSLPWFLTVPIWGLLIAYLSLYPAVAGAMTSALHRRAGGWAVFAFPVLWVGLEFARGRLFGGFPWGSVGYARSGGLPLLQAASIGGVALVSFLTALGWSALAALVSSVVGESSGERDLRSGPDPGAQGRASGTRRSPVGPAVAAAAALALIVAVWAAGAGRLASHPEAPGAARFLDLEEPGETRAVPGTVGWGKAQDAMSGPRKQPGQVFRIALVQGGYGSDFDSDQGPRALAGYQLLTRLGARYAPDLIVWPESNAPYRPEPDEAFRALLSGLSHEAGAPILLGSVGGDSTTGYTNSAYLVGPKGILARYDKRRLVQYGEYVPMKGIFPFVRKFVPEAGDFRAGNGIGVLGVGGIPVGVAICYEIIFPEEVLAQARAGARVLVNVTNDSWFPGSGPAQHAEFARVRGVETGLWVARAANTGITLVSDPLGRILAQGPLGGAAVAFAEIPIGGVAPRGASGPTWFVRTGEWVGAGCAALSALALAFLIVVPIMEGRYRPGTGRATRGRRRTWN